MLCNHDYQLIDKHEFKTPLEVATSQGIVTTDGVEDLQASGVLTQQMVWTFKCSKCNKLKQITRSL